MGSPCKAVQLTTIRYSMWCRAREQILPIVASRKDLDSPSIHLLQASDSNLKFAFIADSLGFCSREPEGSGIIQGRIEPVDSRSADDEPLAA